MSTGTPRRPGGNIPLINSAAATFSALSLVLGGCPPPVTLVTDELVPSPIVGTFYKDTYCHHEWCGDLCLHGTRPDVPRSGTVLVGYYHFYDPGTDPFPCTEKVDIVYAGAVRFELSTFDSIVSATLHFKWDWTKMTGVGTTANSALTKLGIATYDWPSMVMPGDLEIGYLPVPAEEFLDMSHGDHDFSIEVSNVARSWINHERRNFGFILSGPDNGYPENNDVWESQYRNFTLTVVYNPAFNPRRH